MRSLKEECEVAKAKVTKDSDGRRDSRDRDAKRSRSRSRSPRGRYRSRSRSRSPADRFYPLKNDTSSSDPKLMHARVFIGNLPHNRINRQELEEIFCKYGKVLGISILRGYGFVQYANESDAREAVRMEYGSLLKGAQLDIKMAVEGRGRGGGRGGFRGRGRGGRGGGPDWGDRDRSPPGGYGRRDEPYGRGGGDHRRRSDMMDMDEPFRPMGRDPFREHPREPLRDPLRDPLRESLRDPLREPLRDSLRDSLRDPLLAPMRDPLRDPFLNPYFRRDPLRDPLAIRETMREPGLSAAMSDKPPYDCEIIISSPKVRDYSDDIQRRLKGLGLIVEIREVIDPKGVPRAVDDAHRLKLPYALILHEDNKLHRSCTVNIIHGTPQEHRNMPLEDAIKLLARDFESYVAELKAKAQQAMTAATAPAVAKVAETPSSGSSSGKPQFAPPDSDTHYLLNLLADNRFLTLEELDKVLSYLRERRAHLYDSQMGINRKEEPRRAEGASIAPSGSQNGGQQQYTGVSRPQENAAAGGGGGGSAPITSINFDNPNVQKALDNLISGGSDLLKNISSISVPSQQPGEAIQSGAHMSAGSNTVGATAGSGMGVVRNPSPGYTQTGYGVQQGYRHQPPPPPPPQQPHIQYTGRY